MLVLTRKVGQKIVVNNDITIEVVEVKGDRVRIGIIAPKDVEVHRQEVWLRIHGDDPTPPPENDTNNGDAGKEAA